MKNLKQITSYFFIVVIILIALTCDTQKPFQQTPPNINYQISLFHNPSENFTYADFGVTLVNLTVELRDEDASFIAGKSINFTWENLDNQLTLGEIEYIDSETDENGKFNIRFKDNGQPGVIVIFAKFTDEYENEAFVSDTITVLPLESKVSTLTLVSDAGSNDNMVLIADNYPDSLYSTTFTAHVRDSSNNPVENLNVNFNNLSTTSFSNSMSEYETITCPFNASSAYIKLFKMLLFLYSLFSILELYSYTAVIVHPDHDLLD